MVNKKKSNKQAKKSSRCVEHFAASINNKQANKHAFCFFDQCVELQVEGANADVFVLLTLAINTATVLGEE